MPISPARAAAFDILLRVERESSYASELLHSEAYKRLSAADHALTTELVMGVLRWRSRLDDEITHASLQPLSRLDLEILISLRLGLYQFRWLDRIPQRAALHESVELVKRARKRSAAPFVNAVLRKLSNNPPCSYVPPVVIPQSPEAVAATWSHPLWLVERWATNYGLAAAESICRHDQSVPKTSIRLRTPEAEASLQSEQIALANGAFLSTARTVESGDITGSHAFRNGAIVIQDEASQLVAALLGRTLGKGSRILDCCAAPGGKTLAIADQNPRAAITATELHPHRARLLKKLLTAAKATTHIDVITGDARNLPVVAPFDRVLADVPCSGTGTLVRNPEIKWRLMPADLTELYNRQLSILRAALAQVAPRGRLIYSTCSLEKEENENVVEFILAENKSFHLVDCNSELENLRSAGKLAWPDPSSLTRGPYLRTIPGIHPCDGFFAAILERS
jgi:16S rRNA (cytosine967-C5)-methyltransferase